MKSVLIKYVFFLFLVTGILVNGCRKDKLLTDSSAKVDFSSDTLMFDTVFTTIGTVTKYFKVYNPNKQRIRISSIRLAGGPASDFRMNVDGVSAYNVQEVEIAANDSLYIFVEATIDYNNQNNPLIIMDSILFETNGNSQKVLLTAWGQDAYFFNDSIICDMTWNNDKPYVIYNSIMVDSNCTLTINAGVKVHFHKNSALFVKGYLIVNGAVGDTIIFQGDRLEGFYDDLPGQWAGIFILRGSTGSIINYAVVKNSTWGISIGSHTVPDLSEFTLLNAPDLQLKHTIIKNSFGTGIFGFLSFIDAENCLIYNCLEHNVQLVFGGGYDFKHCTFANYSSAVLNHRQPILHLGNFAEDNQAHYSADLTANFTNCIIYGELDEEIKMDNDSIGGFNFLFENCLIKTELSIVSANYISVLKNVDPKFIEPHGDIMDYHLQSTSPCIDAGKDVSIADDLDGNFRDANPDIGAYEYQ